MMNTTFCQTMLLLLLLVVVGALSAREQDTAKNSNFIILTPTDNEQFEKTTSVGQWLFLLYLILSALTIVGISISLTQDLDSQHRTKCPDEDLKTAALAVARTADRYQKLGQYFNISKVDCSSVPDPCFDYSATKKFPYLGVNYHNLVKKAVSLKALPQSQQEGDDFKDWVDQQIEGDVTSLDEENFHNLTAEGHWLLELYAPFAVNKHSRDFWSGWKKLGARAAQSKAVSAGRILCTPEINAALCSYFLNMTDPNSLPAIYWYYLGRAEGYHGLWAPETIFEWWQQSRVQVAERKPPNTQPSDQEQPNQTSAPRTDKGTKGVPKGKKEGKKARKGEKKLGNKARTNDEL